MIFVKGRNVDSVSLTILLLNSLQLHKVLLEQKTTKHMYLYILQMNGISFRLNEYCSSSIFKSVVRRG